MHQRLTNLSLRRNILSRVAHHFEQRLNSHGFVFLCYIFSLIYFYRATLQSYVSVSVASQFPIETGRWIEQVFFWHGSFLRPILYCCKKIWVSLKIRLPAGTLSPTPELENFATFCQSRCQQNLSTVELVDLT